MQIIESSVFGLRSAIWSFEHPESGLTVTVFPMVHIGDQAFYDAVSKRLGSYDIILTEGVRSRTGWWLAASYRQMVKNPKFGLVAQAEMNLDHLRARIVHADVDGVDFDQRWQNLSAFNRLVFPPLSALFGLYLRLFGSRRMVVKHGKLDLLPARQEVLGTENDDAREDLVLHWRDAKLITELDGQIEQMSQPEGKRIGVVYGARHIRAVIHHLVSNLGFRAQGADWLTVVAL